MRFKAAISVTLLLSSLLPMGAVTRADELRVAVASNFVSTARLLAEQFHQVSGHEATLVQGSTGKLYAQAVNGAPYDVFLAADQERPEALEQAGRAVNGSRFTYALGKLVLWSPTPGLVDSQGEVLRHGGFRHLAIANPDLAPYGRAAREILQQLGLWQSLQDRLVRGESIGQAQQFVRSGAAELGLLAASQLLGVDGSRWEIPAKLHQPIAQQAALLRDTGVARAFLEFMQSEPARALIRAQGYETP